MNIGQRVHLLSNPRAKGEIGDIVQEDGTAYFVMWDDGYGQDRGLPRPATVESAVTIETEA